MGRPSSTGPRSEEIRRTSSSRASTASNRVRSAFPARPCFRSHGKDRWRSQSGLGPSRTLCTERSRRCPSRRRGRRERSSKTFSPPTTTRRVRLWPSYASAVSTGRRPASISSCHPAIASSRGSTRAPARRGSPRTAGSSRSVTTTCSLARAFRRSRTARAASALSPRGGTTSVASRGARRRTRCGSPESVPAAPGGSTR